VITLSAIIGAVVLAAVGYQLIQLWDIHRSSKDMPRRPITGPEALVGAAAEVVEAFARRGPTTPALGRVRIGSELWRAELPAESEHLASVGDEVRVVGVSGMVLKVEWR
jgi:membrane protein implicated in regulation of membrane protease activity